MNRIICSSNDCTLCMACLNACPKNAIYIDCDANGYEKVAIDSSMCIDCDLCETVCKRRKNISGNIPLCTFAGQAKDRKSLRKSASGGAFQSIAQAVLELEGVCYGCASEYDNGKFTAKHFRVSSREQLSRILNSKYIPSFIGNSFREVKIDLDAGKLVLFSGTPCQILGLQAFLNKPYDNLLTADLVCHGVTATKLFNDYIENLEKRDDITVVEYAFRDKSITWGTNYSYRYFSNSDKKKRIRERHCPREESSYMYHYLSGNIFRESCYHCRLSSQNRISDFTLGDYWKIEKEHPEFILSSRTKMTLKGGISCILVNTEKGIQFLPKLKEKMVMHEVLLESIKANNSNLCYPSAMGKQREQVINLYRENGYEVIEDQYRNSVGKKMFVYRIKNFLKSYLPDWMRIWLFHLPLLRRTIFRK